MSENINPEQNNAEAEDVDVVAHGLGEEAVEDICVINNRADLA